jgi:hypothetical protein
MCFVFAECPEPPEIDTVGLRTNQNVLDTGRIYMSEEVLKAELERLRSENASLKKGAATGIRMKVSEKGALSIYGMGRFPVTLYKEQWLKLLDMATEIRTFIAENDAQLKTKE